MNKSKSRTQRVLRMPKSAEQAAEHKSGPATNAPDGAASDAQGPGIAPTTPIVGVGASAGGLEALTQLLKHLPANTGMAYVLVQHLDPQRVSILPELLSKATRMPVRVADDGTIVQPNTVFVLPPDKHLTVTRGALSLTARADSGSPHHPIDRFLRSLAADQKSRAIAVILSGSGSDGALGLKAVKEEGGIALAQDEASAQHASMPQSAIATGLVDFVLPPDGIARELTRLGQHPYLTEAESAAALPQQEAAPLSRILNLVGTRFGIDFNQYHPATLQRRTRRRMLLTGTATLADYASYLSEHKDEPAALLNDFLVRTTRFFRDPETFEFLQQKVIPSILKDRATKAPEDPVRVWVPACATGEEAYSLAMALIETAESLGHRVPMQLFGSDASESAINHARKGRYPESISEDVSPERLRRFFARSAGHYVVAESLRKMFVFATHNLLRNPPFSRMDLVSCRNLLIYLEPAAQRLALSALHYAGKPGGILLLGSAESVGQAPHLFHQIDKRYKVFSKQPVRERFLIGSMRKYEPEQEPRAKETPPVDPQAEADRMALLHYCLPSLLINEDLNILQFRGDTSPYIEPAAGKASFNILDMIRKELRFGLRTAISKAQKDSSPVIREGLRLTSRGGHRNVDVEVAPIRAGSASDRFFLVVFREGALVRTREVRGRAARSGKDSAVVAQLKKELLETKRELQSILEEQRNTVEALQAANEELQSANEELQSTNEELETSSEEVEATNEELTTVNAELQTRNRELTSLTKLVATVFDTVREPLLVLDSSLRVQRANRAFHLLFGLSPDETTGCFVGQLQAGQWASPELILRLAEMVSTRAPFEKLEVQAAYPGVKGGHLTFNARPLQIDDGEGILLAIQHSSTEVAHAEQQEVIRELSTPVLRIGKRVLIVPIVGMLDAARARELKRSLLNAIQQQRARVAVLDVTGLAAIDADTANSLRHTADAAKLLGATVIYTGISRQTAQALADLGVGPGNLAAVSDLQSGLEEANRLLGYEVVTQAELASLRDAMRELAKLREKKTSQTASE